MKAGKKKATTANVPAERLVIQTAGSEEEAFERDLKYVEIQRVWARKSADALERGELPDSKQERRVLAGILRLWADNLKVTKPKRRGNPKFERKIYDPDTVALMVGFAIGFGAEVPEAIRQVADQFDVDDSTIAKIFRDRRQAVAQWFVNSNLAYRAGAIRGE